VISDSSETKAPFLGEQDLGHRIYAELYSRFSSKTSFIGKRGETGFYATVFERWFELEREAELSYGLASGELLRHKCDLVLSIRNPKLSLPPILNIELKFRSPVSDAFKARAYDQQHLKRAYPYLFGLLAYVKPARSGISFEQARRIAYSFDVFVFVREAELSQTGVWEPLIKLVENRMAGASKDPRIQSILMQEGS
jgi:hypothetical protein